MSFEDKVNEFMASVPEQEHAELQISEHIVLDTDTPNIIDAVVLKHLDDPEEFADQVTGMVPKGVSQNVYPPNYQPSNSNPDEPVHIFRIYTNTELTRGI